MKKKLTHFLQGVAEAVVGHMFAIWLIVATKSLLYYAGQYAAILGLEIGGV